MLTNVTIKNFKRFDAIDVELGKAVVLIGPNNSGKTTVLQALALWETGLRRWNEKRQGKSSPEKRTGVTINRKDLISIPVGDSNLLWRDLHVKSSRKNNGQQITENVFIDINVEGLSEGNLWRCGLEFYYGNDESFYCRPLRLDEQKNSERMQVPDQAGQTHVAFLPPMSGLAAVEPKWEPGRINVLLGEGQTAQILRNLCLQIYERANIGSDWNKLVEHIRNLFGAEIMPPQFVKDRGEITMRYKEHNKIELDLLSSGRGLQQTLLLLAHLYSNPNTILLLDEPDAHLEVLRQRQIYQLLTNIAEEKNSQIIAASHSEVVLNEAADRDIVIAFVGKPHRLDDRGSQLLKALKEIGFEQYYQAEQTGWVLYLEGSTDLEVLRKIASRLKHKSEEILNGRPFVYYVGNVPQKARDHFYALLEAKKDLVGIAIFDGIDKELQQDRRLREMKWRKRELENYLCKREVLLSYAKSGQPCDLFGQAGAEKRQEIMEKAIREIESAFETLNKPSPWSDEIKATDDFLDPLFEKYFKILSLPNLLLKNDYHQLVEFLPDQLVDGEIIEKLDAIVEVALKANPNERDDRDNS
jgi:ABC-type lipoprotein export system ATPase subunit